MNGDESPLAGFHTGNVLHVLYQLGFKVRKISEHNEAIFFDEPIYCKALDKTLGAFVLTPLSINLVSPS